MLSAVGQFVFISSSGFLIQAHTDGEMHASQSVDNAGDEERWNVYVWPGGQLALQNFRTNLWLTAEADTFKAICNRTQPAQWEHWTLYSAGISASGGDGDGVHIRLRSWQNRWLCAQPPGQDTDGGGEVIANREDAGPWETFAMIPSPLMEKRNQSWWNDVSNAVKTAADLAPILIEAAG